MNTSAKGVNPENQSLPSASDWLYNDYLSSIYFYFNRHKTSDSIAVKLHKTAN